MEHDEPGLFDLPADALPDPRTRPQPAHNDDPGPPSPPVPTWEQIVAGVQHAQRNPLTPADTDGPRDGDTFDEQQDLGRLNGQCRAVLAAMSDHQWHTLAWLAKHRFGGRVIDRRRVAGGNGLHEYRLDPDKRQPEPVPDLTLPHVVQLVAEIDSEPYEPCSALVVLCCRQCGWRYELPEGSTVQNAHDALARHPRKGPTRMISRLIAAVSGAITLTGAVYMAATVVAHGAGASTAPHLTEHAQVQPHQRGHYAHIVIENDLPASGRYPVHTAVKAWGYGLHYGRCVAAYPCFRVVGRRLGGTHLQGVTQYTATGGLVTLNLSARPSMNYWGRRNIITHELGHTLGLPHVHNPSDIMAPAHDLRSHRGQYKITHADRATIHRLYGTPWHR